MNRTIFYALAAAALFGASTPFAKRLDGEMSPVLLAGLLYLGSGVGLSIARIVRDGGWQSPRLHRSEWPWLLGAILLGGVVGPVAMMWGLRTTSGSAASLLLNLEAVLTAVIAWVVFRENAGRRMIFGMAAIVAGGLLLAWPGTASSSSNWSGPLLVALACLCWGIDNNLTRKVSASDALFIAASKGMIAGLVNTVLALSQGASLPDISITLATMAVGNITDAEQVNQILLAGRADLVCLARPHLADPYWTLHQAMALGDAGVDWPLPYLPGRDQARRLAERAAEVIRV